MEDIGKNSPDTRLKVDFTTRNPDDAISDIPYEKGYAFLQTVETAVGRDKFDAFLTNYFKYYSFQSITTEDFVDYSKGRKMFEAAEEYIFTTDWQGHIRFDIVSVKLGYKPEIVHFEDAIN